MPSDLSLSTSLLKVLGERRWLGKPWGLVLTCLMLLLLVVGCTGGGGPAGWAGLVLEGDTLYVGSLQGRVLAYSLEVRAKPGQVFPGPGEWIFPPQGQRDLEKTYLGSIYSTPVVDGGALYIGTFGTGKSQGKIYVLDGAKGGVMWQGPFIAKGGIMGSPVLAGDTLLVASGDGRLYFLDPAIGVERRAAVKVGGPLWGAPLVIGELAYLASMDHKIYVVNIRTGAIVKDPLFEARGALAVSPVLVGNTLYFGSFDRKFYAVDASTGGERWSEPFSAVGWFWSQPLVVGDTLYVGSLDGRIYALDVATGQMRWDAPFEAQGQIKASPVLEAGVLVVADAEGLVYGLDPATGRPVWPQSYDVRSPVLSALVAQEGVVYMMSRDGILRALDVKAGYSRWWVKTDQVGAQAVEP